MLPLRVKIIDYFKAMLVPSEALAMLTAVSCYPELKEMYVFSMFKMTLWGGGSAE